MDNHHILWYTRVRKEEIAATEEVITMEDILIDGEKIRSLRNKRRWTQKQLAMVSGVDQSIISNLENNAKPGTRIETLVALARAFGVATDDLFVPAEPIPVEPTDPKLDVMMRLVEDMTEEEKQSVEMFIRFVWSQHKKQQYAKRK
jgi:transcriptional regulator with XRE-family HTH domain